VSFNQNQSLFANSIVTSIPIAEDTSFNQNQSLSLNNVTTGIPILTPAFYNAALRRIVDLSSPNNTSVVLDDVGENIVILHNFINTATLNSPINTATLNSTINTVSLNEPMNEVA
jgi:hypothetical protein